MAQERHSGCSCCGGGCEFKDCCCCLDCIYGIVIDGPDGFDGVVMEDVSYSNCTWQWTYSVGDESMFATFQCANGDDCSESSLTLEYTNADEQHFTGVASPSEVCSCDPFDLSFDLLLFYDGEDDPPPDPISVAFAIRECVIDDDEVCCIDGQMPRTVTATISDTNCPELDGLAVELTWDAPSQRWLGDTPEDACECQGGFFNGEEHAQQLQLICDHTGGGPFGAPNCRNFIQHFSSFFCGGPVQNFAMIGCSCNPLFLEFTLTYSGTPQCCPDANVTVSITVTE